MPHGLNKNINRKPVLICVCGHDFNGLLFFYLKHKIMELQNIILDIINDITTEKERKNIDPQICTKFELKKELNAMTERILENLVNDGSIHEGPLSSGVYFEIN